MVDREEDIYYYTERPYRQQDHKVGTVRERFYPNGQISSREFWVEGKLHRDPKDGIAHKVLYPNSQIWYQGFFVDGKQLTDAEVATLPSSCDGGVGRE